MKKIAFAFILLAFACTKEEVASQSNFGEAVVAEYSKNINFKNDISLKINNLEESRCPKNTTCVWEGMVKIFANFSDKTTSKDIVIEFNSKSLPTSFELSGQKYEVQITDVLPYPEASKKIELNSYKVNMVVKKI